MDHTGLSSRFEILKFVGHDIVQDVIHQDVAIYTDILSASLWKFELPWSFETRHTIVRDFCAKYIGCATNIQKGLGYNV